MSQLGQKRRFMPAQAMSAPPPVSGPSMHRSTYALRAIRRLAWFAQVTRIPTSLVSAGAGGARPERVQNLLLLRPIQGALVWSGWPLLAYWKPSAFAGCVELAFLKLWTSPGISAYASPALKVCGGFPSTS
jgi:hypothetical protein